MAVGPDVAAGAPVAGNDKTMVTRSRTCTRNGFMPAIFRHAPAENQRRVAGLGHAARAPPE